MRPFSALSGVIAALLGAASGSGFCYYCGLTHTQAMNCAPFLILGIGLDDMYVLLNAYSLSYMQSSARQRIRHTLEEGGIAVTITTLTNVVSFTIGASSPYFAVKNFCIVIVAG
ncbi:Sterol-sensing domain of SREBP cleavage-activation domain-containing protein [Cardiosporidium cionae]|uniref:Sterol-sensing domain of SREBP cleavage-activation domain-containing protein n=1 Tax=Cardiosporidium cionae TaxID=476202 RepID=A0ABQ7JBR4_9APIC|nr:Sterol-sensing domain of SREBP cleavage-activation domain-containing protein [Cardiosporidium cionae]|eukprot:KAF8821354.1 Sterol-sensing domain of SREBP cleavage-activation domain-containing protein [Cardiosporidium cionae]